MTLAELKKLVAKSEGRFLEFKKKADHPEKIVRELVAFANSGGGTLLIGVDDNGAIPGLRFPDEEAYVMEAAISIYSKPKIEYKFGRIKIQSGTEVLMYKVLDGKNKPYFWLANKENQLFRAYVRSKDQSLQASKEMFQLLKFKPDPERQIPIQIQSLEKKLFEFLSENEWITISILAQIGNLTKRKASSCMVGWVKKGILGIEPNELEDHFFLNEKYRDL